MTNGETELGMDPHVEKISESDRSNLEPDVVRVIDDDDESVAISYADIP